jgi:RecA/RadA recombinase
MTPIEELSKEWNFVEIEGDPTKKRLAIGYGYFLIVDTSADPSEWVVEFDGNQIRLEDTHTHAKENAKQFFKAYEKVKPPETEDRESKLEEMERLESAKFEREENERRLAELEKLEQAEAELEEKKAQKPVQPIINNAGSKNELLNLIFEYVGYDVLEVFGDTGSGKTAFVKKVAYEAANAGKKVFYLDTERNLTKNDIDLLKKCTYKYTPVIDEIDRVVQSLPAGDVVILDSVGFPVLTTYARLSMKQKGDALLKLIAIFGSLKEWAYKNNGIVLVTNQPESDFNKAPNHILRPFGDKSQYAAKEIWETVKLDSKPGLTSSSIKAFRSRSVGYGTPIASMKITNSGVEVKQSA